MSSTNFVKTGFDKYYGTGLSKGKLQAYLKSQTLNGDFKTLKVLGTDVQTKSNNVVITPNTIPTYSLKPDPIDYVTSRSGLVMTFANITTAFVTQPPYGEYTFSGYAPANSTTYAFAGTLSISSSGYSGVVVSSKGSSITSIVANGFTLDLTYTVTAVEFYMTLTPTNALTVNGTMETTSLIIPRGTQFVPNFHLGVDVVGKDSDAGKIYYDTIASPNAITFHGAGSAAGSRQINFWDKVHIPNPSGGLSVNGPSSLATVSASGLLTANNGLTVTSGNTSLGVVNASGLISANAGLRVAGSSVTYSLASSTITGPSPSLTKTIANYATAFNVTPLPVGDYTFSISNVGDTLYYWYNGYITVTASGYSNLVETSKAGATVACAISANGTSLVMTYSIVSPLSMEYYRVTMTPLTNFQTSGASRFNAPIGLPYSYTTLPNALYAQLGGTISASLSSAFSTAANTWTNPLSISLLPGVYSVTGCTNFAITAATFAVSISTSTSPTTSEPRQQFTSSGTVSNVMQTITRTIRLLNSATVYLCAYSSIAGNIGTSHTMLEATRIG